MRNASLTTVDTRAGDVGTFFQSSPTRPAVWFSARVALVTFGERRRSARGPARPPPSHLRKARHDLDRSADAALPAPTRRLSRCAGFGRYRRGAGLSGTVAVRSQRVARNIIERSLPRRSPGREVQDESPDASSPGGAGADRAAPPPRELDSARSQRARAFALYTAMGCRRGDRVGAQLGVLTGRK